MTSGPAFLKSCRDCGRDIILRRTYSGVWLPTDPEPNLDGNYRRRASGVIEEIAGDLLEEARGKRVDLYVSHFETCPARSPLSEPGPGPVGDLEPPFQEET